MNLNPTVICEKVFVHEKKFCVNVVRDDLLVGGTKQRALADYVKKESINEFIYAGPVCGMAQLALAVACEKENKKCTLFLSKNPDGLLHRISSEAKEHGANLIVSDRMKKLSEIMEDAKIYESNTNGAFLVPFGINNNEYSSMLKSAIVIAIKDTILENSPPKRLWIAAGSCTLLNVLASIWPSCHFLVVQVGKKVWPDLRGIKNGQILFKSTLYIAKENFYEKAKNPPPYHSNENYDAKIWGLVIEYGQKDDWIWNVG